MRAAGLLCRKLQIAVASPDPLTRAFPGTQVSRKIRSPNRREPRTSMVGWKRAAFIIVIIIIIRMFTIIIITIIIIIIIIISSTFSPCLRGRARPALRPGARARPETGAPSNNFHNHTNQCSHGHNNNDNNNNNNHHHHNNCYNNNTNTNTNTNRY